VAFSDSEKVSTTTACGPTPVAPSLGVTISTAGGVTSVTAAVRKLLENEFVPFPARSLTPPKLIVGRTRTFPGYGFSGVKVTTAPLTANAPATWPLRPSIVMEMAAAPTLVGSTGSLNVHTIVEVTGTPVALFAGLTDETDGRVTSA